MKLDKLVQLFQDMIGKLDKSEGAHTGKSPDEKIEEAVDRKGDRSVRGIEEGANKT